jgi:hypothetical protein
MKLYLDNGQNQEVKTLVGGKGDRLASSLSPPTGGNGNRDDSLLYLSYYNSDNDQKKLESKKREIPQKWRKRKDDDTPNNHEYKIMKSLRENIKIWAKTYGEDRIFFLTLTFEENLTDWKEAQRRFNNFNRQFNRRKDVQWLYKGIEPQKRGALHYHIVGVTEFKMAPEKVDWEAYKKTNEYRDQGNRGMMNKYQRIFSQSNVQEVRDMWKSIRAMAKGSKFGRTEFLPIRSAGCVAQYVGKYLNKTFASKQNGELPKGVRRFSYSNKAPQNFGRQFSWVSSSTGLLTWREKVKVWAHGVGVKDFDDVREKYGAKWAIEFKDDINYFGTLWHGKELRKGHAKPATYPKGQIGDIGKYYGRVESKGEYEQDEDYQWREYLMAQKTNFKHHSMHHVKWKKAEQYKKLNSWAYE